MLAFSAAFGLTSACIGPLIPTLIISFLDADSLASGSGYVLVFEAIGQLLGAPAAGKLYFSSRLLWPFDARCCHTVTAIEHAVPDQVKPSFVIFDIREL